MESVYNMLIKNTARYIRSDENARELYKKEKGLPNHHMDVFTASNVLSVALCKSNEEIALELATIKIN